MSAMNAPSAEALQRCRACDHPRPKGRSPAMIRTTLTRMKDRAAQGCTPCSVLSRGIQEIVSSTAVLQQEEEGIDHLRLDFNMSGAERSLEAYPIGADICISFFYKKSTPDLRETLPDLSAGYSVPPQTSSNESFAWAAEQLAFCKKNHEGCAANAASPLPRRVLDIGTSVNDHIYLRETDGEIEPYVCLSYCWGPRLLLRTLSHNLETHKEGIEEEKLPLTYREAIDFTRRLGIRCLWIDSLCIVQDDLEDWRREAAQMAAIYSGSYLVVSAARSDRADGGLFAGRPQGSAGYGIRLPGTSSGDEAYVRLGFAHTNAMSAPHFHRALFPTLDRGWIFQERFLSSRVLHFGEEELSWECLQASSCQCSGLRPVESPSSRQSGSGWLMKMVQRSVRPKSYYNPAGWAAMTATELDVCWRKLVEDYSRLRLTFEKDVFPALSGLARQFGIATSSVYLAGLWKKSLAADLLWHVDPDPSEDDDGGQSAPWTNRPRVWRAPSWSWAAACGPVSFVIGDEGLEPSCAILEATSVPAGADLMGELSSGHTMLRGTLIPSTVDYREAKPGKAVTPYWLLKCTLLEGRVGSLRVDYDCSIEGEDYVAPGSTLYFFFVGRRNVSRELYFLVLRETGSDSEKNCRMFQRVGLLNIDGGRSPTPTQLWDDYMLSLGQDEVVKIK
ncbi:HET-domain-containing protein [Thozetella sp. PMI_491]|nr:HET-domain-containing protein [Thozetella sp. PMI_491]